VEERAIKKLGKLNEIGINHFVNPVGGKDLYTKEFFKENNFELDFLEHKDIVYKQFNNEFTPRLSIIDVMMFNSVEEINDMLKNYTLLWA